MDIKRLFLEEPLAICIVLGVAEVVIGALWHSRRTRRLTLALAVPPVLALAAGLLAWSVKTEREQIAENLQTIAALLERSDVDAAAQYLHPDVQAVGPLGVALPKWALIRLAKMNLAAYPVRRISLVSVETRTSGASASTDLTTAIHFHPSAGGTGREFLDIGWNITWAKREGRWEIRRVEVTSPAELAGQIFR